MVRMKKWGLLMRKSAEAANVRIVTVCAGAVYEPLTGIAQSYREMCMMLESGEPAADEPVRVYEKERIHHDRFPADMLQILKNAIQNGRSSEIKTRVDELMRHYAALPQNQEIRRFYRYSLIQTVEDALGEKLTDSAAQKRYRLLSVEDATFGKQLSELLLVPEPRHDRDFPQQLKAYIEAHCFDADLSIEGVADLFRVSRQTINAAMKSTVKMTYSDYVTKLRFDRACVLLRENNLKIQDIACQVGYIDTRNFIRKFKACYGVTPGEYQANAGK